MLALVGAACGDDGGGGGGGGDGGGDTIAPATTYDTIGEGEGELELDRLGRLHRGRDDRGYETFDWVEAVREGDGCKVNVKYADTSDEMVTLMRQGGGTVYDGVSASGDASNRLIAGGDVGAIDPALFPAMRERDRAAATRTAGRTTAHYVVDGNVYGVPYMYGPNFLMYNTDVVKPAPTSWDVTFEQPTRRTVRGKITAYDSPIYIADAAMYLMAHSPDLGITDPYELDRSSSTPRWSC